MKVEAKTGRLNKVHISVDGEYRFTVDSEYWYSSKWRSVTEIEDEKVQEEFLKDIGSRYAFISGLRILSYGDNSRKGLRIKLVTKGHLPEYTENALDLLEKYGYINDRRFAAYYSEKLRQSKGMSKKGIRRELLIKGIDSETADEVLEGMGFDSVEDITALLESKYSRYLGDEKGLKKTVSALQRLGYNWADIKSALARVNELKEDDFCD